MARLLRPRPSGRAAPTPVRGRARRGRVAAVTALLAVAVTLLGACSGTGDETATGPPPPEPQARYAKFYGQVPKWGPCTGYATSAQDEAVFADPSLDCTRVEVPLDYERPQAASAFIAMVRKKATGDRLGSLFFNPGGPGVPGTSYLANKAADLARTPLGERFDLIGFDPRGVGTSRPTIDCLDDRENDEQRRLVFADPSPAGVAAAEANSIQFKDRCVQRTGAAVLGLMGTRDAARDLDVLRQVVGDPRLSYVGYSYGTELGTAYAEQFPGRVRAMVLDGAVDPTQSSVDSSAKQAAGFQLAFDDFAKDCATRPDCPLGPDPAQATRTFQAIMQPLIDRPVPLSDGRVLSFPDAITGVTQALYLSDYWPILRRGISEVASGRGRVLSVLADAYNERGDDGRYTNSLEAFAAITCVNQPPVLGREVADLAERSEQVAPFRSTGRGPVVARDPCAFWPVPPTTTPHTPVVSNLPRTIVVSVTGDPATPYQAGVDLARQLGGSLITVDGNQHTAALKGNRCLDDQVTDYLVEPSSLPEGDGQRCRLERS